MTDPRVPTLPGLVASQSALPLHPRLRPRALLVILNVEASGSTFVSFVDFITRAAEVTVSDAERI